MKRMLQYNGQRFSTKKGAQDDRMMQVVAVSDSISRPALAALAKVSYGSASRFIANLTNAGVLFETGGKKRLDGVTAALVGEEHLELMGDVRTGGRVYGKAPGFDDLAEQFLLERDPVTIDIGQ